MRAGNSSIPPEGLRQGLHTEEIRQGAIERTTASNSLAPASRTNRPFFNVSEHIKTRMIIDIAVFIVGLGLSHRISGGNMTHC